MIEKTKVIYVAEDGTGFDKKQECIEHEHKVSHYAELKEALKEVRKICQNHYCSDCPFASYGECFATDREWFEDDEQGRYVEPSEWTF